MKCTTCHRNLDAEKHPIYRFPKQFKNDGADVVFCCYDCMTAWLFKHMDKSEPVIGNGKKAEDKSMETDKDSGGWF